MEDNTNTTPETVVAAENTAEETVVAPVVEETTTAPAPEATTAPAATEEGIRTNTAGDADIDAETHAREVAQNKEANGLA